MAAIEQRPNVVRGGDILRIPRGSLMVTVGAAGAGKSTLLRHLPPSLAVVNPDSIRHELLGDASDHSQEPRVWRTVWKRIEDHLAAGRAVALDSTAASREVRRDVRRLARRYGAPLIWVILDTPLATSLARNRARYDPQRSGPVPDEVVRRQHAAISRVLLDPAQLGGDEVLVLRPHETANLAVEEGGEESAFSTSAT